MTTPYYSDDLVTLHLGDCLEVMRALPDASVDAVVTDPPYGLEFMGKGSAASASNANGWYLDLAVRRLSKPIQPDIFGGPS